MKLCMVTIDTVNGSSLESKNTLHFKLSMK